MTRNMSVLSCFRHLHSVYLGRCIAQNNCEPSHVWQSRRLFPRLYSVLPAYFSFPALLAPRLFFFRLFGYSSRHSTSVRESRQPREQWSEKSAAHAIQLTQVDLPYRISAIQIRHYLQKDKGMSFSFTTEIRVRKCNEAFVRVCVFLL